MPLSEARKRASAKWDHEHMTTVGVKVTRELAQEFAEACRALGVTKGRIFREAISRTIDDAKKTGES